MATAQSGRGLAPSGRGLAPSGRVPLQAVFLYWLTSNSFSLLQTGLLRVPALRARLRVPAPPPPPQATPTQGSGPAPSAGGVLAKLRQSESGGGGVANWGEIGKKRG